MKEPKTSNSITDRVQYTGLYVPEMGEGDGTGSAETDADPRAIAFAAPSEPVTVVQGRA